MSQAETKTFNYDLGDAKVLFEPIQVGDFKLDGRIVLAPLTRCRSKDDFSPGPHAAEMYKQRSTAALIIAEATQICQQGQGYSNTPGIYTQAHVEGWKHVTKAVHDQGKPIVLQLWHVGRVSNHYFQPGHGAPVSSSAVRGNDKVYTPEGLQEPETPRALETKEVEALVQQYKKSAQLAKEANFDGVEVHSAHGYLLDQFLQDGVNKRTDKYGGSLENRCRFLFEVLDAVLQVWPSSRVGIRIAPSGGMHSMFDSDYKTLFSHVAKKVDQLKLAYLSVSEPRSLVGQELDDVSRQMSSVYFMKNFKTPVMAAGGYTPENAIEHIKDHTTDMVAFGRWYISNPDLPERIKIGAPLVKYNRDLFYDTSAGAHGYTDYPSLSSEEKAKYTSKHSTNNVKSNGNISSTNQATSGKVNGDNKDSKQQENSSLGDEVKGALDKLTVSN